MTNTELEGKIRGLRQLQSLIEEAQAEAETIKGAIKAHMGRQEVLRAGEYTVTWKPVTTERVDITALRTAMPQVVELFTKEIHTRRFCVA